MKTMSGLGGLLARTEIFDEAQIDELVQHDHEQDANLTELIVEKGFAEEQDFLKAIASLLNSEFVELGTRTIEPDVLDSLPTKAVFQYHVMPIEIRSGSLLVATQDPFNPGLVDALRLAAGMRIRLVLSTSAEIDKAIRTFYGVGAETVDQLIEEDRIEIEVGADSLQKVEIDESDQEASIVTFVNQIIWEAFQEKATDIHLEPMEERLRIRYRVDGMLVETPLPSKLSRFQAAISSRVKVMANLDIAEKRLPQDGRIGLRMQGHDIDIRVSSMPTVYGESISLRILTRGTEFIGLSGLGISDKGANIIREIIHRPNGIILVTGPTGSGKSTSLYAYLHELNSLDVRILTVEDPIEYEMPGINQVHVREDIGLSFSHALRAFLRQDPDIIMVGEIRDFDTAETAIRAALTGHLVFSTLHTNDAAGAVTRLLDMGVEPFLVASSVKGIVAQRLVRRLCEACREPEEPRDRVFMESIGFPMDELDGNVIYAPKGCEACRQTGYRGRTGIYEVMKVTETVEPLIIQRESSSVIKQNACGAGMVTLRDDGWDKVLKGVTSIDEILRVSEDSD
jgi:type II secretion system protein E